MRNVELVKVELQGSLSRMTGKLFLRGFSRIGYTVDRPGKSPAISLLGSDGQLWATLKLTWKPDGDLLPGTKIWLLEMARVYNSSGKRGWPLPCTTIYFIGIVPNGEDDHFRRVVLATYSGSLFAFPAPPQINNWLTWELDKSLEVMEAKKFCPDKDIFRYYGGEVFKSMESERLLPCPSELTLGPVSWGRDVIMACII
jgi:hypothetical protein